MAGDHKIDTFIYDQNRLLRLTNTQHGDSQLWKIPLETATVIAGSVDHICKLAKQRQEVEFPDWDDVVPIPASPLSTRPRNTPMWFCIRLQHQIPHRTSSGRALPQHCCWYLPSNTLRLSHLLQIKAPEDKQVCKPLIPFAKPPEDPGFVRIRTVIEPPLHDLKMAAGAT